MRPWGGMTIDALRLKTPPPDQGLRGFLFSIPATEVLLCGHAYFPDVASTQKANADIARIFVTHRSRSRAATPTSSSASTKTLRKTRSEKPIAVSPRNCIRPQPRRPEGRRGVQGTLQRQRQILGDEARRKRFDAGEIDAQGDEKPPRHFYRDYAEHPDNPYTSSAGYADFDGDDVFSGISAATPAARGPPTGAAPMSPIGAGRFSRTRSMAPTSKSRCRRRHARRHAAAGGARRPGAAPARQGAARTGRRRAGDALVEIEVRPHRQFTRKGDDIHIELPISLADAVLGGEYRRSHADRKSPHDRAEMDQ